MNYFLLSCLFLLLQEGITAPPRRNEKPPPANTNEKSQETGLENLGIEYERYLKEVIDVLESDPEFKRKLEAAEETDIRTGKIAHELDFVDHSVRSKLDEVKRSEIERLRHLAQREYELTNGIDVDHMKIMPPEHLDHDNPHTFEINDLKKLIAKVTNDLNEADQKRRVEFKEYEMQKEFENSEKLKHLEGSEKESFQKELKDNETKHKQHEPLHHPGSRKQLEEVWEKQDHMAQQEFNPKVFFQLHDLDGNGYWDQNEVKALFIKELDKMYQAGAPEDDMREREEELERMREHVFREADKNQDQLISFQEFLDQTKQPEFEKDPSWETVDQEPAYSRDEYIEFERRRQQEVQHMIQQGLIPPQAVYNVPPGYHHPQMQQFPQGHPQQIQQHGPVYPHPNQIPQQHMGDPGQRQIYGHGPPQGNFNPNPQGHAPNQPYHDPNSVYSNQGHPNPPQLQPNGQGYQAQMPQYGGPQQHQINPQGIGGAQQHQINPQGIGNAQQHQINPQGPGGAQQHQINPQGIGSAQQHQINPQGPGGAQPVHQNAHNLGDSQQGLDSLKSDHPETGGVQPAHQNAQVHESAQQGHQNANEVRGMKQDYPGAGSAHNPQAGQVVHPNANDLGNGQKESKFGGAQQVHPKA